MGTVNVNVNGDVPYLLSMSMGTFPICHVFVNVNGDVPYLSRFYLGVNQYAMRTPPNCHAQGVSIKKRPHGFCCVFRKYPADDRCSALKQLFFRHLFSQSYDSRQYDSATPRFGPPSNLYHIFADFRSFQDFSLPILKGAPPYVYQVFSKLSALYP